MDVKATAAAPVSRSAQGVPGAPPSDHGHGVPGAPSAEFVALVALTTSLVAMSIDTMLPALGTMATELGAAHANDRQLVLSTFFGGLSLGQLLYGPVSDHTGRRPALFFGIGSFIVGNLLCTAGRASSGRVRSGRTTHRFGRARPRRVCGA
jgi:DHA1 family bicyclomycin/chloramphenicol resistance-like MFS transporter